MHRQQIVSLIIVGIVAIGGIAFAKVSLVHHVNDSLQSTKTSSNDPKQSQPRVKAATIGPSKVNDQSGNCNKNISETNNTSGTNVSNSKTTVVQCKSVSQNGTTSVNITNDNNQSAHTGSSDGQTGTATNTDTTNINVGNN